ncbi:MAG: RluA family pseudouridine synthase [Deltaproteobacteria bacterium]|nr:RluA family pseudouridine synthase [Deltaproteobacteria bacterium]
MDHAILRDGDFKAMSRSAIQHLIESGCVKLQGKVVTRSGMKVRKGQVIELRLEAPDKESLERYDLALETLYEDEFLIVINKPAGLSMHPGAGIRSKTLLNAIAGRLAVAPENWPAGARPGVVHRLDMDTTGLIVVAKDPVTHRHLSAQFAERTVERQYVALALCTPRGNRVLRQEQRGTIETKMGRDPRSRIKMAVLKEGGRTAVTHWEVIERMHYACYLLLKLETGRTHQIRVHLNHIHSPIIGDKVYGDFSLLPSNLRLAADKFARQALHARTLGFVHPSSGRSLQFEREPPKDFLELVELFRQN